MAKQIRQVGRALLLILPLVVLAVIFVLPQRPSEAAFHDPFWDNVSSSPECACANCGCEGAPEWFPEGAGLSVNVRTREVVWDHALFHMPGLVADNVFSIRWRSTIDGESQMGHGMLPELGGDRREGDPQPRGAGRLGRPRSLDPTALGPHRRLRLGRFGLQRPSCNVLDVLTVDGNDDYVLSDSGATTGPWTVATGCRTATPTETATTTSTRTTAAGR